MAIFLPLDYRLCCLMSRILDTRRLGYVPGECRGQLLYFFITLWSEFYMGRHFCGFLQVVVLCRPRFRQGLKASPALYRRCSYLAVL